MSDIPTTARTARESLARGLTALQSDPNIPPQLVELAAPIAQAMGALMQIERSNGATLSPHAETALSNVRTALSQLQQQPPNHPAVAAAMEAVAGSLGMVHALNKLVAQPAAVSPIAATAPQQGPAPAWGAPPAQAAPAPAPAWGAPQQAAPPQQAYAPPPQAAPPQQAYAPQPARDPFAAPQPQGAARSPMAATAVGPSAPAGGGGAGTPMSGRPPAPAPIDAPVVNADLGAHSPTNFYKGLAGNDIIDHGGLFVSTYMIPKIGAPVRLRVSLPGGYEFEANGIVRWSREQGGDAPPGFGAQFTQISPEAKQLIYRYVRNREPLFHDDF